LPFALARPALGKRLDESSPGDVESRLVESVKKRVKDWEKIVSDSVTGHDPLRPFYPGNKKAAALGTESVLNALILVKDDTRRGGGTLSEQTNQALDHLWAQQQAGGAWLWLDFGLRPWEKDGDYYGAALAAVAVGTAGKKYPKHADVQGNVTALKSYLKTRFPVQPLHNRLLGLWASSKLEGVLTTEDKKKLIEEVLAAQGSDGGWGLPKLGKKASGGGEWERHGAYPAEATSDGYATGLVVLALKRAGVPTDDQRLRKGVDWLITHEKEGAWPAIYINTERAPETNVGKFMRDAATAFAVLALTDFDQ
jgi:squalene-hopene/tetraprenyl-beta-curcumene cyclase